MTRRDALRYTLIPEDPLKAWTSMHPFVSAMRLKIEKCLLSFEQIVAVKYHGSFAENITRLGRTKEEFSEDIEKQRLHRRISASRRLISDKVRPTMMWFAKLRQPNLQKKKRSRQVGQIRATDKVESELCKWMLF
uniref:Uncharacterized protein n=1 Tax=Oryza punctata TaxID=4537 RepID=A0A0E0MN77_ORYPU